MRRSATLLLALTLAAGVPLAAAAPASAAPGCPPGHAGELSAAAVHGANVLRCALEHVTVRNGAAAAEIPEPGITVESDALTTEPGTGDYLRISVSDTGDVEVVTDESAAGHGSHKSAGDGATTGTTSTTSSYNRCSDPSYVLLTPRWTPPAMYVNSTDGLPAGVSPATFRSIAAASYATWTNQTNDCGMPRTAAVPGGVLNGAYRYRANIGATGSCGTRDGIDVLDFGNLPGSALGLTCRWWTSSGVRLEGDTRLDDSMRSWVTTAVGCSGASYDLQSVLTHELGHYIGLGHATEYGGNDLTMSPYATACNTSARVLGEGDVLGIRALFP